MVYYKTSEEIELLRISCELVSKTLAHIGSILKPGMTGLQLDKEAETFIRDNDAVPGFLDYRGFPNTLCISMNEAVVHGIPTKQEISEEDILSIDCGTYINEFYGDSAYTFAMPGVSEDSIKLLKSTYESLYKGIEQAEIGNRIGDISSCIQKYNEKNGFTVVRELVGHGIGKELHEAPEVPNYGIKGRGPKLKEGLVIAIEPMINMGKRAITQSSDGWTIVTKDGLPSAHYEHSIAITNNGPDILSNNKYIEEAIKNNSEIQTISINI